jgi:uncharacterized membrane protein YphA (DoxX/SURF4 family)
MFFSGLALMTSAIPILIGCILVLAGLAKFTTLRSFREIVAQYRILPAPWVKWVFWLIPTVEVLAGALLLLGFRVPDCCAVAALLFAIFAVGITINLFRGRQDISCGCFGANGSRISWFLVARNASLSATALISAILYGRFSTSPFDRANTALIVFACVALVGLVQAFNKMSYEDRPPEASPARGI